MIQYGKDEKGFYRMEKRFEQDLKCLEHPMSENA
jgi:hypothetical protein